MDLPDDVCILVLATVTFWFTYRGMKLTRTGIIYRVNSLEWE